MIVSPKYIATNFVCHIWLLYKIYNMAIIYEYIFVFVFKWLNVYESWIIND